MFSVYESLQVFDKRKITTVEDKLIETDHLQEGVFSWGISEPSCLGWL